MSVAASAAYSVVLLPEPVGPVTRMMPSEAVQPVLEQRQVVGLQAERVELEAAVFGLRQQPQHRRFAVHAGDHRDAHFGVDAGGAGREAAVLRQPALGDVEPGDQLDAARHRVELEPRVRFGRAQYAIDAIAHREALFARLDVDVRGAEVGAAGQHRGDELDDRRVLRQLAQIERAAARRGLALPRRLRVQAGQRRRHVLAGGQHRLHRALRRAALHLVEQLGQQRIACHQPQRVGPGGAYKGLPALRQRLGQGIGLGERVGRPEGDFRLLAAPPQRQGQLA